MTGKGVLYCARGITVLCTMAWLALGLLFFIKEGAAIQVMIPGAVSAILALIAWISPLAGGILLLLITAVIPYFFRGLPLSLVAVLAAPSLISGILFLVHWSKEEPSPQNRPDH